MTRLITPRPLLVWLLLMPPNVLAQCSWMGKLVSSFIPREVNSEAIHGFSQITPQDFMQLALAGEKETLSSTRTLSLPEQAGELQSALAKFYAVGAQLYGVKLDPQLRIVDSLDINAFATGHTVNIHVGLLIYFLNPSQYWEAVGLPEAAQHTPWSGDWDGVFAVVAHEAAHNVMQHVQEGEVTAFNSVVSDYVAELRHQRQRLANGQTGSGMEHYFAGVFSRFAEQLDAPQQQQKRETEADVVGIQLLQGAGFDPASLYRASEKLDIFTRVVGAGPKNWKGAVAEALCSDHPSWVRRLQDEASALSCLQSTGKLCQQHITLPTDRFLADIRRSSEEAEKYTLQTSYYVNLKEPNATTVAAQINIKPETADLLIDGLPVRAGAVQLTLGKHVAHVAADGYESQEAMLVAFPDIAPHVTIKLKRLRN